MRAPIKSTIFLWRNKAKQGTRTKRYLQAHLRRKNQRIARLEEQNAALQKQLHPTWIYGHTYPAEMICLAVFMVIAGCSYRASARTLVPKALVILNTLGQGEALALLQR